MQHVQRLFPVAAIYQVVPVGDDVVDRTAVVAERNAAVHTARTLLFSLGIAQMRDEFLIMLQTLLDRRVTFTDAIKFHESGWLTHDEHP
ncbi:MAG: hypothetical protein A3J99_03110 [Sideroxydans sp. RIFOXYD2_FULL_59_7]|nr:MAG: hypothetical protein A3J99_03110 [Sideroxydans sp. RIFOXYD2_FULL_59_7]